MNFPNHKSMIIIGIAVNILVNGGLDVTYRVEAKFPSSQKETVIERVAGQEEKQGVFLGDLKGTVVTFERG